MQIIHPHSFECPLRTIFGELFLITEWVRAAAWKLRQRTVRLSVGVVGGVLLQSIGDRNGELPFCSRRRRVGSVSGLRLVSQLVVKLLNLISPWH